MSTGKLLKALNDYLQLDRTAPECDAARSVLEFELEAYNEEHSLAGAVKSILVAVDGSEPAQWAVDEAVRLARTLDAAVSLVHVVDVAPALPTEFAVNDATKQPGALEDATRELMHGLADRVPAEMLGEQLLREGNAAKQIIAAARDSGVDLLVIGTHGRGPLGRFLLGSVAEAVVRHCICPVLTVGHPCVGAAPEPYAVHSPYRSRFGASVADSAAPRETRIALAGRTIQVTKWPKCEADVRRQSCRIGQTGAPYENH